MLAAALLEHARKAGRQVVTVNAAPASILFWEALGFLPDPRHGHSHIALIQPVGSISVILPLREPPIRHSPGRAGAAADQVGGLFGDHDYRRVDIAADQIGHHRGIDDAQPLDTVNAEFAHRPRRPPPDHGPCGTSRAGGAR